MAIPADVSPVLGNAALDGFRDTEVGDERVGSLRENVRRLDVAVDYAALVRECERVDDVMQNPHDLARAELLLPLERGAERLAFDVRHRVPQQIALLSGGEERHDMWML